MISNYLVCNKFAGLHRVDSSFSDKKITASDIQNIELFDTGINSGVGIRTSKGNVAVCDLIPNDESVVAIFESVQSNTSYFIIYTENESQGKLYNFNLNANTLSIITDNLSVTGIADGCDFAQGWTDLFIFSNGMDLVSVNFNASPHVNTISVLDPDNRPVKGLGLVNFDGRIWIFEKNILRYSVKEDFDDFSTSNSEMITSAGFIEYSKNITAICPFLGSLIVFFDDSSVIINAPYPFSQSKYIQGGCSGHNALTLHDTHLFFFDKTKNAIFSFKQISTGDITLQSGIALDVQQELFDISPADAPQIVARSVITSDRNEMWWLLPDNDNLEYSTILIYDYLRQEWIKRKSQKLVDFKVINHSLYSASHKILQEYVGNTFDGEFIPAFYNCSPLNFGFDNIIKILYYPPKLTLDINFSNEFFVEYVKNYDILNQVKIKKIKSKSLFKILYWDVGYFDSGFHYPPAKADAVAKLLPAFFKTLQIKFFTQNSRQDFAIKNLEFHKIKAKFSGT